MEGTSTSTWTLSGKEIGKRQESFRVSVVLYQDFFQHSSVNYYQPLELRDVFLAHHRLLYSRLN